MEDAEWVEENSSSTEAPGRNLQSVKVIQANQTSDKCDSFTASRGFECVPYYQVGTVTGAGLLLFPPVLNWAASVVQREPSSPTGWG